MPRQNRQKLHKELRLRAEARKRVLHERRQQRLAARERSRRALLGGRRRHRRVGDGLPMGELLFQQVRDLLRLADARRGETTRVRRLYHALAEQMPREAAVRSLPWLLLLARQPWVRAPETFRAADFTDRDERDGLTRHLLTKWPVPTFLLRAAHVEGVDVARIPVEDEWAVSVLAHVGQGRSLAKIVGTDAMPAPLTRRMQALFLDAPDSATPVEALRSAQVVGFGGPEALVGALLRTRLRGVRGPDTGVGEPFWHDVIGWLCRRRDLAFETLPADEAEGVLGWIEARRRESLHQGTPFSLAGRTGRTVRRDAAAWRAAQEATELPASGLHRRGFLCGRHHWTFTELTTGGALVAEGVAMGHCVGAYAFLVRTQKAAVWSMRRDDDRVRVTIEVAVGAGAVVQARGRFNRRCTPEELQVLSQWAHWNRLQVQLR